MFFLLILVSLNTYSQTKKETQDWLLLTLNKYCSTNYDIDVAKAAILPMYYYTDYTYEFPTDGVFKIIKDEHRRNSLGKDSFIKTTSVEVNLKAVIKIDKIVSQPDIFLKNGSASLNFTFKKPEYDSSHNLVQQSVFLYDETNKIPISTGSEYQWGYKEFISVNSEAVKGEIMDRIINALNFLVDLNGGKIIKDIF